MDFATTAVHSDADKIRDKIKEAGLTQNHVAKAIGVHYTHLSYVLNGKKDLTEDLREKLNKYLAGVVS